MTWEEIAFIVIGGILVIGIGIGLAYYIKKWLENRDKNSESESGSASSEASEVKLTDEQKKKVLSDLKTKCSSKGKSDCENDKECQYVDSVFLPKCGRYDDGSFGHGPFDCKLWDNRRNTCMSHLGCRWKESSPSSSTGLCKGYQYGTDLNCEWANNKEDCEFHGENIGKHANKINEFAGYQRCKWYGEREDIPGRCDVKLQ
jgi:hypothetical protein